MKPICICFICKRDLYAGVNEDDCPQASMHVFCNHCAQPICRNCWPEHRKLHYSPIRSIAGAEIYKPRGRFTRPAPKTKPAVQTAFDFPE